MRVLDIDLDFFVRPVALYRTPDDGRLDPDCYSSLNVEAAIGYLEKHCQLDGPRPGWVVEDHRDIFFRWGKAIEERVLTPPLDVVHLDAHADLGLGEAKYIYLMSDLAFQPMQARYARLLHGAPEVGEPPRASDISDGNWLSFALACGWLSRLTYVCTADQGSPTDLLHLLMRDFDREAQELQLAAVEKEHLVNRLGGRKPTPDALDPPVPFTRTPWRDFQADGQFDVVCLTRSPAYTPATADALFEEIRKRFVDEEALS